MDVREHPCLAVPNSLTHEVHCWVHTMALETEPSSKNELPKYPCPAEDLPASIPSRCPSSLRLCLAGPQN